jgi:hypothetical protein
MTEKLGLENVKKTETINREKKSEVLLRFLNSAKNIESFHGKKIEDIFSTEEDKRGFIDNLQNNEFTELLNGVNGILRGKNKDDWNMDGEAVGLESALLGTAYAPPRQEDKLELFAKTLTSAKEMNKEKRSLEDIALLVSSSLNAIHPYIDANGRTSRLIYLLLTNNFEKKNQEELRQILGEYGRDKLDIDPGLIQWELESLIDKEIGIKNPEINTDKITNLFGWKNKLRFNEEILEEDKNLFGELLNKDSHYLFLSVFKYLQNNKGDKEKCLRKFPERSAILVDLLSKNLNQEGLSQILENYRELKKEYVEKLIDCIEHPEKEEYQIEDEGKKISLKNYYEIKIKEKIDKIAEEDRLAEEKRAKKL